MADLQTQILEDTELRASAHSSQESGLQHPNLATKSKKHSIKTQFLERPNLRSLLENENDGFFAEDALAKLQLVQRSPVT